MAALLRSDPNYRSPNYRIARADTRCRHCGKLVCGWCFNHVHGLAQTIVPRPSAEADDALGVTREWRDQHE